MQAPNLPQIPWSQLANNGRLSALWMLAITTAIVLILAFCLLAHIGSANAIIDDLGWGLKIGFGLITGLSLGHSILEKKGNGTPPAAPTA